jgi:hypothetical protein
MNQPQFLRLTPQRTMPHQVKTPMVPDGAIEQEIPTPMIVVPVQRR